MRIRYYLIISEINFNYQLVVYDKETFTGCRHTYMVKSSSPKETTFIINISVSKKNEI